MSGHCEKCGNTLCICNEVEAQTCKGRVASGSDYVKKNVNVLKNALAAGHETDHHCGYCGEILENTNESR